MIDPRYRIVRLYFIAILCALLAACTSAWAISLEEEIDLGRRVDAEILSQTRLTEDEEAQKEIETIGGQLIKNVRRPEIKYHFRIIQQDELNAFAVPGGYIYFTDKLWKVLRPDERIGVLSHEIVHVDRRHALDAISKMQRRQIWLAVLLAALNANETWGDVAGIAHQLYTLKYSRGDERQADEIGVELSSKAGYNPAGLLLAMRKIRRFHSESGGEPPKVFSSHPPTSERVDYIETLLKKMNVETPPESVGRVEAPDKVGAVTSINGSIATIKADSSLNSDTVVWITRDGWDFRYENKTDVPIARGVVITGGTSASAQVRLFDRGPGESIEPGMSVHAPAVPKIESFLGEIVSESGSRGRLKIDGQMNELNRYLAQGIVWDTENNKVKYDTVGYVVITNSASDTGYVASVRPEYGYVDIDLGVLLSNAEDPKKDLWMGPIISIGKSGQTIELLTNREISTEKIYDVVLPPWKPDVKYRDRVVGTARFQSSKKKTVLKMSSYTPGWSISDISTGFDIYEQREDATDQKDEPAKPGSANT